MRILALILLLASSAMAATTRDCTTLYSAGPAVLTSTNGDVKRIGDLIKHLKFIMTATPNSGTTPTLDVKIQHCRMNADGTCSTSCSDTAVVFTQCTTGACSTDGVEHIDVNTDTVNFLPCVRAVTTLGGTNPNYTVRVEMCHAK